MQFRCDSDLEFPRWLLFTPKPRLRPFPDSHQRTQKINMKILFHEAVSHCRRKSVLHGKLHCLYLAHPSRYLILAFIVLELFYNIFMGNWQTYRNTSGLLEIQSVLSTLYLENNQFRPICILISIFLILKCVSSDSLEPVTTSDLSWIKWVEAILLIGTHFCIWGFMIYLPSFSLLRSFPLSIQQLMGINNFIGKMSHNILRWRLPKSGMCACWTLFLIEPHSWKGSWYHLVSPPHDRN